MRVAKEHFRLVLGPGDFRALNAKQNNRHQASGFVLEIASFILVLRPLATMERADFGMSLMIFVDLRSWSNPAGMSSI